MRSDYAFQLAVGDQAWVGGALAAARAAYVEAARFAPTSWRAGFGIAWIDLAFGPIDAIRLDELVRAAPTADWRDALSARAGEVALGVILEGGIATWDIEALRRSATASSEWWELRALRAHAARQYGLARACYDEASNYTSIYDYDPPRSYNRAVVAGSRFIEALQQCDC
jgi:hypothetical protein